MKFVVTCCIVMAVTFGILVACAKEPTADRPGDAPLGGFLKLGDRVALVEAKESPGMVLRLVTAKDLELIEKSKSSDEVLQIVDEKTLSDAIKKQNLELPEAFERLGLFDAGEINAQLTRSLKEARICSIVAITANYVVLKFDDRKLPKEILVPLQQIRRIERGNGILDNR